MSFPRIELKRSAAHAIQGGHPWVFREAIAKTTGTLVEGESVHVAHDGRVLGTALADPTSPLVARMWSRDARSVDGALFFERFAAAVRLRTMFVDPNTNAYRLLNGEGDRTPGIVIDRYDTCAVVRTDGKGAHALYTKIQQPLWRELQTLGITSLVVAGVTVEGEPCTRIAVREHGMPFWVDIATGQKTGAFLDQRENRLRVRTLASGKRVLNLFSYAGGFSMAAAMGKATRVTSVDIAAKAHATARESFKLAGLDPAPHAFVSADAFEFLKQAHVKKETWDLVICDPPSFAPNERSKDRAMASYRRLHAACAAVLAEGGVLCAASCSSHISQEDFLQTLDPQTLGQRNLKLVAAYGPPEDHPTLPEFPEGRYLKFMVLA